jgi:hypothetical protein
MTFYDKLKEFFKTNDPHRLYMANKIARKFRTGTEQKVVLNRLKIIYENGGPSEIVLGPTVINTPTVESEVSEIMSDTQEERASVEIEIEIDGEAPEITIETPDDEKES